MNVALVYVFPNLRQMVYEPLARRFAESYMKNPPGESGHSVHVVVNGQDLGGKQPHLFDPIPVQFHQHNNYGKDIGAFMMAAHTIPCDLILCLGSHVNFHRGGWLDRILDVYLTGGPGLYGCWGFMQPSPHIRTTAFWCPPDLLTGYPHAVSDDRRYAFEHSYKDSILKFAQEVGLPVAMVTWSRVLQFPNFDHVPPEESLMLDQHTERHG